MIYRHIFTVFFIVLFLLLSGSGLSLLAQTPEQKLPSPDEFIEVDQEPVVDMASLQKAVVYPELARRTGVEGRVWVMALVGTDGTVLKAEIKESSSEYLNQAALNAMRKAVFEPAMKNGQPVAAWTITPIEFRLRDPGKTLHPPAKYLLDYLTTLVNRNEQERPVNLYNRGLVYYKIGQRDNAENDFLLASQLNPSAYWKPYQEAGLNEILGVPMDTTNAPMLTKRAELLLNYDLERALADFTTAIEIAPSYLYAYVGRAKIYTRKGMCTEAILDAKKFVGALPENPELLAALGRCYYELGEYKQALLTSARAVELVPSLALGRYTAALAILRMDDTYKKALDVYKEAYKMDSRDESLRSQAILDLQNLIKQGIRTKEAQQILKEVFHVE